MSIVEITDLQLHPVHTRRETGTITPHVIVTLDTREGISGLGEMSDLGHYSLRDFPPLSRLRGTLLEALRGRDPADITDLTARLAQTFPGGPFHNEIRCGVELALWDAVARNAQVPVYQLLGGKVRDRYRVCYPIFRMRASDEIPDNLRRVRDLMRRGQDAFRLYWGADIEADERFLAAVRDEYGDQVEIKSLDGSNQLPRDEAIAALRRLIRYRPTHIESPCQREDLADMRAVRETIGAAVSEHVASLQQGYEFVAAQAVDIFNISLVAMGGLAAARKLYALAEATGTKTLIGTTQELSIGTAAQLHLGAAMPNLDYAGDAAGPLLYQQDVVRQRIQYCQGYALVPEGPGWGLELDPEALAANHAKFG